MREGDILFFCWNLMANNLKLPRIRPMAPSDFSGYSYLHDPLLKLFCSSQFFFHLFPLIGGTVVGDKCDQKSRFICASWVLNAAAWKQQPEAKLPQILILALVVFASGHLVNNFPPLFLGLRLSLTQPSSVCRGRVLMAHVKCSVLK